MQCKFRQFLALIISVGITTLVLCIFNRDQAAVNLEQLVSETHKQLETLKANLQQQPHDDNKNLQVDDKYVYMLGFDNDKRGTDVSYHSNKQQQQGFLDTQLPSYYASDDGLVVVTSVQKDQLHLTPQFIKNIQETLPGTPIQIWNVDPSTPTTAEDPPTEFSATLSNICNNTAATSASSTPHYCTIKRFNFEDYPDHLKDDTMKAYRPMIIQTNLLEFSKNECLVWLDIDRMFVRFIEEKSKPVGSVIHDLIRMVRSEGKSSLIGWGNHHPTSSLTHPKMFSYFGTSPEAYYFHRMISASTLIVCKGGESSVFESVMRGWVACCLKKDCVAPFGAQSSGCRFDKKPLYRYSGCHGYDEAGLNVALGVGFPLHQPYIARGSSVSKSVVGERKGGRVDFNSNVQGE